MTMGALDYLKDELATLKEGACCSIREPSKGPQGARARFDGREVINLASNNYLGLANHPAAEPGGRSKAAAASSGPGAGRSARSPAR